MSPRDVHRRGKIRDQMTDAMEGIVNESLTDNGSGYGSGDGNGGDYDQVPIKALAYNPTLITVVLMLSTFSIVGVIGNAIAFYIFFRRRNSSTSVIFILTLAGTDFFTCLITIPYTVVFELLQYHLVYDLACKTYMFLITSTVPFSAYIMVGIALDRYFCICHPFLHAVNMARAKVIIFCMGIPALGFGIITALSYGTHTYVPERLHRVDFNFTAGDDLAPDADLTFQVPQDTYEPSADASEAERYLALARLWHAEMSDDGNATSPWNYTAFSPRTRYGQCVPKNSTFSSEFQRIYQVVHALNFAIAYVAVATLYILIYKEIYTRRARKAKRRKNNLYLVESSKDNKHKKETLQTDLHSDNGPSMKLANLKDRREQVGARKIVPTIKNDLNPRNPASNFAPNEPGEDETVSLLAQIESNGAKPQLPPRAVALCEKVYDGRDSDEGETDTDALTPLTHPKATGNHAVTCPAQSEGWPDNGQGSQLVPLLRKDGQPPLPSSVIGEPDGPSQVLEPTDVNDVSADSSHTNRHVGNSKIQSHLTADSPGRTYTLPYPHEESFVDSSAAPPSSHAPPTVAATTATATATATATTKMTTGPPRSLALKSSHAPNAAPNNEPKHKSKHWQNDAQTNSIKRKRPSTARDRNLMANIKTAIMLFIVILVFLVAFLPSLLMANKLIPFHLIPFYGYFVYNVANPFIYAFMNQTFREDLRKILNVCGR